MLSEQQKYDLNLFIEALKIKVTTIHTELEGDLTKELWDKYDEKLDSLRTLINDLEEEIYYG